MPQSLPPALAPPVLCWGLVQLLRALLPGQQRWSVGHAGLMPAFQGTLGTMCLPQRGALARWVPPHQSHECHHVTTSACGPAAREGWAIFELQLGLPSSLEEGELSICGVCIKLKVALSFRRAWSGPEINCSLKKPEPNPTKPTKQPPKSLFQEFSKSP